MHLLLFVMPHCDPCAQLLGSWYQPHTGMYSFVHPTAFRSSSVHFKSSRMGSDVVSHRPLVNCTMSGFLQTSQPVIPVILQGGLLHLTSGLKYPQTSAVTVVEGHGLDGSFISDVQVVIEEVVVDSHDPSVIL